MEYSYAHIFDEISRDEALVIEPFRGNGSLYGVMLMSETKYWFIPKKEWWDDFLSDLRKSTATWVVFDMRRIMDFGIDDANIVDMKTICGGGSSLLARMKELLPKSYITGRLAEIEAAGAANLQAMKIAQVDYARRLPETMTPQFFENYLRTRSQSIRELYTKTTNADKLNDWFRRLDFVKVLHEVEQNGIYVNKEYVDDQLLKQHDPATVKCFRSMQSLYKNGYVTSLFNAAGTKTGRLRSEGGFGAMGIPHGPARKAIVSRFKSGKIYSFDYNAIDYRSIVSAIGGQFASLYADSKDFHTRTAQFIFKDVDAVRREAFKIISYTSIYGGSLETLSERAGLSKEIVQMVLDKLKEPLEPITRFREELWSKFQINGYIDIPGVGRYNRVEEDMHPGKLLALYAQGYSAYIFEMAMTRVHKFLRNKGRGSCIIFPVHDELVLDVHPDDEELVVDIKNIMETGVSNGFVVNFGKGNSYGEVE